MRRSLVLMALAVLTSACGLPFLSPSLPTTAELINGAADSLAKATGLEISGSFMQGTDEYTLDFGLVPPDMAQFRITKNNLLIEGRQIGDKVYYLSPDLVRTVLGSDPNAKKLAKAFNDRWITSKAGNLLNLTEITNPARVKANFLNTLAVKRNDNVQSGGAMTAELSTTDYTEYITESSPHRLTLVKTTRDKEVDGVLNAAIAFTNYNKHYEVVAPSDVLNLDDPNTWPPLYERVALYGDQCNDPCVIRAVFQNYGGTGKALGPSTVTFTLSRGKDASGDLGSCKATIQPDVAHGQQVTESCTIASDAWIAYGMLAYFDAVPSNPAYD